MMTEEKTVTSSKLVRKVLLPALGGAGVGFATAAGIARFAASDAAGGLDDSALIASVIGALYTVIGLGLVIGVARPGFGARFLNVEDADELREQQRALALSSLATLLWGVGLVAVALAGPGGPVPPTLALVIGAGGLAGGAVLSIAVYRASDELMRAINLEAGSLSFGLAVLIVGLWAMLAHLGFAAAPAPLDLLSLFYGLIFAASFVAIGRRGMLMPR